MTQSGTVSRFWWRAADHAVAPEQAVVFSGPVNVRGPATDRMRPGPQLHRKNRGRSALISGIVGALVFASFTSFGQNARFAEPLPVQIDRALVAAGFSVSEVSLLGHRYTTDTEIYGALGLEQSGSLLTYDVVAARQRVLSLPWVMTAEISRVFPDRLRVKVTERQPIAIWEHQGRSSLVDRTGRVLSHLSGSGRVQLTRITGEGAPAAIDALLATLKPYDDIVSRLEVAHRVGGRRWTLELAGGARILLPADRDGEALLRLQRHQAAGRGQDLAQQTIDLRQDGLIALSGAPAVSEVAQTTLPRGPSL